MKKNIILYTGFMICLFSACNQSKSEAQKKSGKISSAVNEQTKGISEGVYMKATINGKAWTASKMMPDLSTNSNYKQILGETDKYTISFSVYKPTTGSKRNLDENYVIDFSDEDDIYGGKKGEVIITKADDKWIEGSFYFTANNSRSNKVYEVTNGSFRVETNPKK